MAERTRLLTPPRVALGALLALTLVVRLGVLLAMRDNLRQDPDAYRNIAENVVWFQVYGMGMSRSEPPRPTAYRPPLYPIVLAKFGSDDAGVVLWRVGAVHVALALATVWLVWIVAGQVERSVASIVFRFSAGLLVACDPILLHQSTLVMTETLAAFLTVLCLFCLNRFSAQREPWTAGLAGGAIGLAILCRPTYLPWLGLVGLAMLLMKGNPKRHRGPNADAPSLTLRVTSDWLWRGLNLAALGLFAAIVVSPWAIRNYRVFGKPIVSTTHGGYTLLLGNNEDFYNHIASDRASEPWDAQRFHEFWRFNTTEVELSHSWARENAAQIRGDRFLSRYLSHPELQTDFMAYSEAREFIEDNQVAFMHACLYRVRQLWSPLPHQLTAKETLGRRLLRYAVCVWYVGVYALAAVGIWRLRGKLLAPPWLWGVLLCLVFTAVHTFYWTNLRMRAPLMPVVALVAAQGLATLWAWWRGRKHRVG